MQDLLIFTLASGVDRIRASQRCPILIPGTWQRGVTGADAIKVSNQLTLKQGEDPV